MKFFKQLKDEKKSFELTEKEVRFELEPHYKDVDLMIDGLKNGDYMEDRPIQTLTSFYWAEQETKGD